MGNRTALIFAFVLLWAFTSSVEGQTTRVASDKKVITKFESDAERIHVQRETLRSRVPKISVDATPAEIETNKRSLLEAMALARKDAKMGELFTSDAKKLIRKIIQTELKGWKRDELRKTVLQETRGVVLNVNSVYPPSRELVEMSPSLLLALPQLPRSMRYRFAGQYLAILDRDTGIVIDFMKNALA
ncbi:MAG: hypothetical protein WKF34_05280 [Pyrinomonadaceae bacterium]